MSRTTEPMSRPLMNTPMAMVRRPASRAMFMAPDVSVSVAMLPSGTEPPSGVGTTITSSDTPATRAGSAFISTDDG